MGVDRFAKSFGFPRSWLVRFAGVTAGLAVFATPSIGDAATAGGTAISCSGEATGSDCLALGNEYGSPYPTGLSPAQIKAAYNWPTKLSAGAGQTIAIVDAHDNPQIESDLAVFDKQYALPSCTIVNGCFTKVDSRGGTNYPPYNKGWGFEIEIDVQWAHAIAPGAKILLVEAKTANLADMLVAEDYAKQHAQYVSNSWVTPEFKSESSDDSHFVQAGVSFFAGSGDAALTTYYPSASPDVVSVGGTQLNFNPDGTLLSETGWAHGGGGCSKFETAKPAQSGFASYPQVGCGGMRATPDVGAESSDLSRVSVYDSGNYLNGGNWFGAFGTSIASPLWAARTADAGIVVNAATVYSSTITYRAITAGGNGAPCLPGYNLCAGRGSWIGTNP